MKKLSKSDIENFGFIKTLYSFKGVKEVFLYGSRARGDHRIDSDIDIAISGNIDLKTEIKLKEITLNNKDTLLPIDLIILNSTYNKELLKNIEKESIKLRPIYQ